MDKRIEDLITKLNALEDEIDQALNERRKEFGYEIEKRKIKFQAEVKKQQKKVKTNLYRFFIDARLRHLASAPFLYMMIIPFSLMDLMLVVYQNTFFRACGLPLVKRADYVVIDRHQLAYLNIIEKINCIYCGYVNGLIAYVREIAGRSEQYWCPIKHGLKTKQTHRHYGQFTDFGDAESYRKELHDLREKLRKLEG